MIKNNRIEIDKAVAYGRFDELKRWIP